MSNHVDAPSARALLTMRRTYNRPTNDEGTEFETWRDTIDRVIMHQLWLWERALERPLNEVEMQELSQLRKLMLDRKVSVSGRTLWLGGTDIAKRREASQFNPLPYETRLISDRGVVTLGEFEDGEKVTVLTHEGNWKPATAMRAGIRQMLRLKLRRGRTQTTQDTSLDHTWILKDGSRVTADQLKLGDQFHKAPTNTFYDWNFEDAETAEQFWWCYGFVYGDGAIAKSGKSVTSRVRLCGDKAKYLSRFEACGFKASFPPSCGGDPFVYTGAYLKTLPEQDADAKLIKAFIHGYLAADGHKKNQRGEIVYNGFSTTSDDTWAFMTQWLPVFGVYILDHNFTERETNYGTFEGFEPSLTTFGQPGGNLWTVEGIEKIEAQTCYCLTVEDDHSFVLENGIVTGNCSFLRVETVSDIADAFWLLLQGCGVGFEPIPGILNGFPQSLEVEVIPSTRSGKGGEERNRETHRRGVWTIKVGDSAEAWAKVPAKIMANKKKATKLILDFSEVRPAGERLKGYGWISSGDASFTKALVKICDIMNLYAGKILPRIAIMDVMNWLGTTLSSRRSAEIAVVPWGDPEAETFAAAKRDYWVNNPQREQSNNSLLFYQRPSKYELLYVFDTMMKAGGSEPGFINAAEAHRRAPWFKGVNPCAEILLGNKSFCNLVEVCVSKFNGDFLGLITALKLAARANYRQTCVDLHDEVLQSSWHELNMFLRLCGVGLTGIVGWEHHDNPERIRALRMAAQDGAHDMADALGLPRAKAVTTIKPSGTLSKVMDCAEGIHKPLGRYILNNMNFSKHDPLIPQLRQAGYRVFDHPTDPANVLVSFPVCYETIDFETSAQGVPVNLESAVSQLERYKLYMQHYVDHNCSITVSYDPSEVPAIVDWLMENWNHYVGVSFLYRNDPTKTAADLGYLYLPQEVITEEQYSAYASKLKPVNLDSVSSLDEIIGEGCATGACPIR